MWWNRLPAERNVFFDRCYKEWESVDEWMNIPLGDPKEKEYRKKILAKGVLMSGGDGLFSDMRRAARFESCDWQYPIREGNVVAILLPDMQQTRMFARLLAAKAHLEIAEGQYDEAVRTLQTGYAEARHVAQGQTISSAR